MRTTLSTTKELESTISNVDGIHVGSAVASGNIAQENRENYQQILLLLSFALQTQKEMEVHSE